MIRVWTILCLFIVCVTTWAENQPTTYVEFNPPYLLWLTDSERESIIENRERLAQTEAAQTLHQQATEALEEDPIPLDVIVYEGHVSNHPDRIRSAKHLHDMLDIRALLWTCLLTNDERFANTAIHYVTAWAQTYIPTGNDVNENKLIICFWAYDLLRDRYSEADRATIEAWIARIAEHQIDQWTDGYSSNRHGKRLKIIKLAGLALGRDDWKTFVDSKVDSFMNLALNADGTTRDLKRRDAMHYNVSCLSSVVKLAVLYRNEGVDLYTKETESGATLKRCVDFILPYVRGEKVYPEWVNTTVDLDRRRWEAGDPYYRPGKPWDPREAREMLLLTSLLDPSLLDVAQALEPDVDHTDAMMEEVLNRIGAH